MPSIRPYQFKNLPRLTREQAALFESLAVFLGRRPLAEGFAENLGRILENYLKEPVRFSGSDLRCLTRDEVTQLLPRVGCTVVVGLGPTTSKVLVDIESGLVSFAIDRLLGGASEVTRIQRALTEIEEGVLSYLILKTLAHFQTGWSAGTELSLTLDRFAPGVDSLHDALAADTTFHLIGVRVGVGKKVGHARIFIPGQLVTSHFGAPVPQDEIEAIEFPAFRRSLESLGETTVEGRVEIATVDLASEQLAQLTLKDIILLENHQLRLSALGVTGEAFIRVGDGHNGGVRGRIFFEGETSKLEISEIVVQEQPVEVPMTDSELGQGLDGGDDQTGGDNLPETAGLLRDVPAPIVVELGRIRLNTNQVARLRKGQILRLPRGPNDPVNLVVHGKLFARGELIEVDGELGIRLIQVAGT